jgi:hypothetical protein
LQDDPFLKNLAINLDQADEEIIRDQRENRVIPVEISVAAVGYRDDTLYRYGLPPQPPMVLYRITDCDEDEVRAITESPEFMRTLLENRDIPSARFVIPAASGGQRNYVPKLSLCGVLLASRGVIWRGYRGAKPAPTRGQILKQFKQFRDF